MAGKALERLLMEKQDNSKFPEGSLQYVFIFSEKTVIALLMVGLAIYFGVAYEMLRKKRSYTETYDE